MKQRIISPVMKRLALIVGLALVGVVGGFLLWAVSVLMLTVLGLYPSYALGSGFVLAFVIWAIAATIIFFRIRRHRTPVKQSLLSLLAGMLVFHVYTVIATIIDMPQTILFLPR